MLFLFFHLLSRAVLAVQVGDWSVSENQETGTRSHFICVDAVDCVTTSEGNVFLVPLDTFPREQTRLIVRGGIDVAARALARTGETGKVVTDEGFCFECLLDLEPGAWSGSPATSATVLQNTNMLDEDVTQTTLGLLRADFLANAKDLLVSRLRYRRVANVCELFGNGALYVGVALSSISTTIPVLGDYKAICDKLSFISTGLFATHVMLIGCARCLSREQKEREALLKDHANAVGFQLKTMQSVVTDEAENLRLAANQLAVNQFRRKQKVVTPADPSRSGTPGLEAMSLPEPTRAGELRFQQSAANSHEPSVRSATLATMVFDNGHDHGGDGHPIFPGPAVGKRTILKKVQQADSGDGV
jgi:hypothetical protein